jgi:formiminoglutamase
LRTALLRMTADTAGRPAFVDLLAGTVDLGDVLVTGDLDSDQERLADTLAPLLRAGITPVVFGGGHETTYGHFLGYVRAGLDVGILNWDAHADVRPVIDGQGHSGSPFRQALEHPSGRCTRYVVAGLMPWRVSADHAAYVREHGRHYWLHDLSDERVDDILAGVTTQSLASFDLDLVEAGSAPGVSAPGVGGLEPSRWLRAARACGANPSFKSFDVVELNPVYDPAGATAVLAALTVWHILAGIAARPAVGR